MKLILFLKSYFIYSAVSIKVYLPGDDSEGLQSNGIYRKRFLQAMLLLHKSDASRQVGWLSQILRPL